MNGNLDGKLKLLIGEFNSGKLSHHQAKILRDFLDKYAITTYVRDAGDNLTIKQWQYRGEVTIEPSDIVSFDNETREVIQKIVIDRVMSDNKEDCQKRKVVNTADDNAMSSGLEHRLNFLIKYYNEGKLSKPQEKTLFEFLEKYAITYARHQSLENRYMISKWRYKDGVVVKVDDANLIKNIFTMMVIRSKASINRSPEIINNQSKMTAVNSKEQKARAEGEKEKNALAYILKAIVNDPSIPYHTKINSVIALGSASCAIIAVQPIPFADIFILTPVQMVMIYYLNKIISDDADADIDSGSLLATLGAVAGWGLVAQQAILALYKIGLPGFAGFTTIPLVYGATSAIGYMAVKVLEMQIKDKNFNPENMTVQQKQEFERISEQAKKDAKRNKQSLGGLKDLVANSRAQAEQFYNYEKEKARLESQLKENHKELEQEFTKKQIEYESKLLGLKEDYQVLENEQLELMLKNEELSEENKLLLQEFIVVQKQYHDLKTQALEIRKPKREFYQKRMKLYSNIVFEKSSLDEFLLLNEDDNFLVEKLIGCLNSSPDKAHLRCKVEGTDFLEYGFGSQGRVYVKKVGIKYYLYKIGNKATQVNDIKYLKLLR